MQKTINSSVLLKTIVGWLVVFIVRLVPFRPANFEPMLATLMPLSKEQGLFGSFVFGFIGVMLFDSITSGIGLWTIVTAVAYGILGIASHFFFKHRASSVPNFLIFGIVGTLFYDAVTGLTVGPLFFHQPLLLAITGQIPFTLMHLMGTVAFSVTLAPLFALWLRMDQSPIASTELVRS